MRVTSQEDTGEVKLVITVLDEGSGIDPGQLECIFYPNYQEKMGFGLYLCKHICQHLDGDIRISSVKDIGTKVIFSVALERHQEDV